MFEDDVFIMEEHIGKLFQDGMNKHLMNCVIWNDSNNKFYSDVDIKIKYIYYKEVCHALSQDRKVEKRHAMTSEQASQVKTEGHNFEYLFELFGFEVKKGQSKTDLLKEGVSYASLKSPQNKIQWGCHVINSLPKYMHDLLQDWYFLNMEDGDHQTREIFANDIKEYLSEYQTRYKFFSWWFRKFENTPHLILRDKNKFIQVNFQDLISLVACKTKIRLSHSKKKGVGNKICFDVQDPKTFKTTNLIELEVRRDKDSILLHGKIDKILELIYNYNLPIDKIYS